MEIPEEITTAYNYFKLCYEDYKTKGNELSSVNNCDNLAEIDKLNEETVLIRETYKRYENIIEDYKFVDLKFETLMTFLIKTDIISFIMRSTEDNQKYIGAKDIISQYYYNFLNSNSSAIAKKCRYETEKYFNETTIYYVSSVISLIEGNYKGIVLKKTMYGVEPRKEIIGNEKYLAVINEFYGRKKSNDFLLKYLTALKNIIAFYNDGIYKYYSFQML